MSWPAVFYRLTLRVALLGLLAFAWWYREWPHLAYLAVLVLPSLGGLAAQSVWLARHRGRLAHGGCEACGYVLSDLPADARGVVVCPECGAEARS